MASLTDFALGATQGLLDAGAQQAEFNQNLAFSLWLDELEQKRERAKEKAKQYRERAAERREVMRDLMTTEHEHGLKLDEIAARNAGKTSKAPKTVKYRDDGREITERWDPEQQRFVKIGEDVSFKPDTTEEDFVRSRFMDWVKNSRYSSRKEIPAETRRGLSERFRKEYRDIVQGGLDSGSAHNADSAGEALGTVAGSALEAAKRSGLLSDARTPRAERGREPAAAEPDRAMRVGRSAQVPEGDVPGDVDLGLIGGAVDPSSADLEQLREAIERGSFDRSIQQFQSVYGPVKTRQALRELGINPGS